MKFLGKKSQDSEESKVSKVEPRKIRIVNEAPRIKEDTYAKKIEEKLSTYEIVNK
jgi:hypothetical protein